MQCPICLENLPGQALTEDEISHHFHNGKSSAPKNGYLGWPIPDSKTIWGNPERHIVEAIAYQCLHGHGQWIEYKEWIGDYNLCIGSYKEGRMIMKDSH